jgi:rhodanese-related sulfurtransferase
MDHKQKSASGTHSRVSILPQEIYALSSPGWVSATLLEQYTPMLVVDAHFIRAQRVARLLTLAGYRPIVVTRCLRGAWEPAAALIGAVDQANRLPLTRMVEHLAKRRGRELPILALPPSVPEVAPLHADPAIPYFHTSSPSSVAFFEELWRLLPQTRAMLPGLERTLALDVLPESGQDLTPRTSQTLRSSLRHFKLTLNAAARLLASQGRSFVQWQTLLSDVGLAHAVALTRWPDPSTSTNEKDTGDDGGKITDPDDLVVPAVDLTCLNQAVAFSAPDHPQQQLYTWGYQGTETSLLRHRSLVSQRAVRLLPRERVLQVMLNGFTRELDTIRGEALHHWRAQPDGSYLLVHYSNLYVYGRMWGREPACQVWLGALDATLRYVGQEANWIARELECSCQTQTGHCVFSLTPRA